jgi:diguanylate cyclase (GGDEF)-like protein
MPDMDGFETYRVLRQYEEEHERNQTPVIFLTGENNSETERRGLKAGASDFIRKPFDKDILIKRVKNTIDNNKTIESLTEEATLDKLTGFLNKASGTEKITELCRTVNGALMVMDLDNFKLVNDLYGHDMGDRVLVAFSGIVRLNVRNDDVVCRIGGDEFMGFFTDMDKEDSVASITQRLNDQLAEEAIVLMGKDHGIPLGISIGAVFTNENQKDYQILFQYADNALYEVKQEGKHGYRIYDPDTSPGNIREDIDRELARIIKIMAERTEGKGALLLGQEAFLSNYRFIERFLSRYGGNAVRILFSLSSEEKGVLFSEMVSEFGNTLQNTLRKADIVIRWQHNMYFVVLPMFFHDNINILTDRIMKEWSLTGYQDRIKIEYATSVLRKDSYESEK